MTKQKAPKAEFHTATFPEDATVAEQLLREYFSWLELPTTHRGFEEEVKALSTHYSGEAGLLLILKEGPKVLGCVALQRHDAGTAEVRRLYVRDLCKGRGYGELLMKEVIRTAAAMQYRKLVLGAIPKTVTAQALYRKLGFKASEPFYPSSPPGTAFYTLWL